MERYYRTAPPMVALFILVWSSVLPSSLAYRPGDIVPMSRMGQYHSTRTVWHDMIGRHCPIFAVNREALIPIPKPNGYTGADPYKVSFQVGKEKFYVPWLFLINRKSSEVPMIEMHLRYTGGDLLGVTAKVIDMPHSFLSYNVYEDEQNYKTSLVVRVPPSIFSNWPNIPVINVLSSTRINVTDVDVHPNIRKQFWDQQQWPKHILVRYTWEEQSEIDVVSGFYVLFGSGLMLSVILAIYVLQSSKDKFARFVMETVAESSMPADGIAKVE